MKLLILTAMLFTTSAFAQVQVIKPGESVQLKCAGSSSLVVTKSGNKSAIITCESLCRVSAMEYCDYERQVSTGNVTCSSSGTSYYIVVSLPNGQIQKLSSETTDLNTANYNLPSFADFAVERGLCDKATY